MLLAQDVLFNQFLLSDVKILTVDNDPDTGALYTALFENYDITMVTTESVKAALELLCQFVPDVLICEARFLGESVYPLIQQVRSIAQKQHKVIPIFVASTYPDRHFADCLKVTVEAYQTKPINLDQFVAEVWSLILLAKITQPLNTHDWLGSVLKPPQSLDLSYEEWGFDRPLKHALAKLDTGKTSCCCEEVG